MTILLASFAITVIGLVAAGLGLALLRLDQLLRLSEDQITLLMRAEQQRRDLLRDVLEATRPVGFIPFGRKREVELPDVRARIEELLGSDLLLSVTTEAAPSINACEATIPAKEATTNPPGDLTPVHWFHVNSSQRHEVAEAICRRHARRAVVGAGKEAEKLVQLYSFEAAHEVALLYGRTSLLDFTAEDLRRVCVGLAELLERFRLAGISVDRALGLMETFEELRRANDMRYFALVGHAVYSLLGGLSAMTLVRLAYHMGSPKLLLGSRSKSVLTVYFAGQIARMLYAPSDEVTSVSQATFGFASDDGIALSV